MRGEGNVTTCFAVPLSEEQVSEHVRMKSSSLERHYSPLLMKRHKTLGARDAASSLSPVISGGAGPKARKRAVPVSKGRHWVSKGKHWKDAEENRLLDYVADILPRGMYEWEKVAKEYNGTKSAGTMERDVDSCRNKFQALKNVKKPTGDPTTEIPPNVKRARYIQRDINAKISVSTFDDGGKTYEHGDVEEEEDEDNNANKNNTRRMRKR